MERFSGVAGRHLALRNGKLNSSSSSRPRGQRKDHQASRTGRHLRHGLISLSGDSRLQHSHLRRS
jgi:hypothetical protein